MTVRILKAEKWPAMRLTKQVDGLSGKACARLPSGQLRFNRQIFVQMDEDDTLWKSSDCCREETWYDEGDELSCLTGDDQNVLPQDSQSVLQEAVPPVSVTGPRVSKGNDSVKKGGDDGQNDLPKDLQFVPNAVPLVSVTGSRVERNGKDFDKKGADDGRNVRPQHSESVPKDAPVSDTGERKGNDFVKKGGDDGQNDLPQDLESVPKEAVPPVSVTGPRVSKGNDSVKKGGDDGQNVRPQDSESRSEGRGSARPHKPSPGQTPSSGARKGNHYRKKSDHGKNLRPEDSESRAVDMSFSLVSLSFILAVA